MPRAKTQTLFWTPERDRRLKEMWGEQPRKLIADMADEFGISSSYLSHRATVLKLGRRNPKGTPAAKTVSRDPVKAASTPAPRVVVQNDFTPCPYLDPHSEPDPQTGKLKRCGVAVDRRMKRSGATPGPYCKAHECRVLPLEKGPLGALGRSRVTYATSISFRGL